MPYITPRSTDKDDKQQAVEELLENSSHSRNFYVLLVGATIIAIGGIFADSVPLLIASMIVAPLAFPILSFGFGIVTGNWRIIGRTLGVLTIACLISLTIAMLATFLFNDLRTDDVFVTFTGNLGLSFVIALVSGAIAAYGTLQPKIASALTGIAIAVSLLPPLVATGVGLASGDTTLAGHASAIFGLNILGILIASIIVFGSARLGRAYKKQ